MTKHVLYVQNSLCFKIISIVGDFAEYRLHRGWFSTKWNADKFLMTCRLIFLGRLTEHCPVNDTFSDGTEKKKNSELCILHRISEQENNNTRRKYFDKTRTCFQKCAFLLLITMNASVQNRNETQLNSTCDYHFADSENHILEYVSLISNWMSILNKRFRKNKFALMELHQYWMDLTHEKIQKSHDTENSLHDEQK